MKYIVFLFSSFFFIYSCSSCRSVKSDFKCVPLYFIDGFPCLEIYIESKPFLVKLDTGNDFEFNFQDHVFEFLSDKMSNGSIKTFDAHGNIYNQEVVSIPSAQIGTIFFKNISALKEHAKFLYEGSLLINNERSLNLRKRFLEKVSGRMGISAIRVMNYVLLDFPGSNFYMIKDLKEGIRKGVFSLKEFVEVDFCWEGSFIVFHVETDFGVKKFLVDTGSELSIIRPCFDVVNNSFCKSHKFLMNNFDFGPIDLYSYDLTYGIKSDGILGINFLKKYAIYFDFVDKKAFIGPGVKKG